MFFRIHLLLLFFLFNAISAQDDFGPIKSNVIDLLKLEKKDKEEAA